MNNNPKYRLKKDTPNYDAGSIFIVRTDDTNTILLNGNDDIEDINGNFYDKVANIKHFDEWFEEVKEAREPRWVRKQIKQILFDDTREDIIGWKYTNMRYRFIKDYYRYDSQTSFGLYENGTRAEFRFLEKTNSPERDNALHYFNQLVRDGYIEIQDNPNIVWEDDND